MSTDSAHGMPAPRTALPFQPNSLQLGQMPSFERNDVPRYLFRISGPRTAGRTTVSCVIPPASASGQIEEMQDIFKLDPKDSATRLNEHLQWSSAHEPRCNLMSWTSSLLFALQYGLHRHRTDRDEVNLSQILLFVLDTRDFPRGTFVKDVEIISIFASHPNGEGWKNLKNLLKLREGKVRGGRARYFGEYLTQGRLTISGKSAFTNMQSLIDAGLFKLEPRLEDRSRWAKLADVVVYLREPFDTHQDAPAATHDEVRKAVSIARACFGSHWGLPLTMMLLALKPRQTNDPVITEVIMDLFDEEDISHLHAQDIQPDTNRLPEFNQFQRLFNDALQHLTGKEIDSLLDPFNKFSLHQN